MNLTELKRLAEAAKAAFSNSYEHTSNRVDFEIAVSPDVVLGLIKSLEHTTMAAEAEAKEVDERNAVIDKLRTQNQALVEALEDATDEIESWGAYASEYFQEKHDLAGNVAKFRAITQADGGV